MADVLKLKQKQNQDSKAIAKLSRRLRSMNIQSRPRRRARQNRTKRNLTNRVSTLSVQGSLRPQSVNLSPTLHRWMNVVVNPFGSASGAQVPDKIVADTMVFKDYTNMGQYDLYGDTVDLGGVADPYEAPTITGVCIFLVPGSIEANTYYNQNESNTDNSDTYYGYYHVGFSLINGNGLLSSVTPVSYCYNVVPTANEYILLNYVSPETSLSESLRIVGCGFRVWPVIESITSSSTNAIAQIFAGRMLASSFFTEFCTSGTRQNIYNGVTANSSFKMYSNQQGVTCRFNPLQGNDLRAYNLKTQNTWDNNDNMLDTFSIPMVIVKFTQPQTGTDDGDGTVSAFTALPYYFQSVYWLEGVPEVPTPLMPSPSPIDFGFDTIVKSMLASGSVFPDITEGHSFKTLSKKLGKFAQSTSRFLNNASHFGKKVSRGLNAFAEDFEEEDG